MNHVLDAVKPLTEYYQQDMAQQIGCGLRVDASFQKRSASGPMIYEYVGLENPDETGFDKDRPSTFAVMKVVPPGTVLEWLINKDGSGELHWLNNPALNTTRGRLATCTVGKRSSLPAPPVCLSKRIADNDLGEIERLLRERGHVKGFTEKQILAAEKKRKVTFPPELRLFFSLVKDGVVLGEGSGRAPYAQVREGLTCGTGPIGNVVDPRKRWGRKEPLPTMPAASAKDTVQPAYASRDWIAFADDGGGNVYALDLVPGPRGAVGQIVQFDHEKDEPPLLVADSLTAFLRGKLRKPTPWGPPADAGAKVVHAAKATGVKLSPASAATAVELYVSHDSEPLNLGLLAGSRTLTTLRFDTYMKHGNYDLSALTTMTALQNIEAPESVWAQVVEQNAFPPHLASATFSDSRELPLATAVGIANAVLAHYGRDGFELVRERIG